MQPITYKLAIDTKGTITGVELHQAGQHITMSLEAHGLHKSGYRWIDVQENVEALSKTAQQQVINTLGSGYGESTK